MAKSGNFSGSVHSGHYTLKVDWSASQSAANNTSVITAKIYLINDWALDISGRTGNTINIAGKDYSFNSPEIRTKGTHLLATVTSDAIEHNDDGSKTISVSCTWKMQATISDTYYSTISASSILQLDTIPRTSVPTVSASSVTMLNKLTINTNRKSTSFHHTLKFNFVDKDVEVVTNVGDSYEWAVPDLAAYCNNALQSTCTITCVTYNSSGVEVGRETCKVILKVPSATIPKLPDFAIAGEITTINLPRISSNFTHQLSYSYKASQGSIGNGETSVPFYISYELLAQAPDDWWADYVTIYCNTYNGTALVGTTTVSLLAKIPDNEETKPTITDISLSPISSLKSPFNALYIQGLTKVEATYVVDGSYTSVKSVKMTVQSDEVTGTETSATSGYLSSSGTDVDVSVTVTNARGQIRVGSATIPTIYEYSKPLVVATEGNDKVICERCEEDGTIDKTGKNLIIKAKKQYSPIGGNNTCELWYRIKAYDGLPFSEDDAKTILLQKNSPSDEYDYVISDSNGDLKTLKTETSYTVEVGVTDAIGNSSSILYLIKTPNATFHLSNGGKGASFGGYSDNDGLKVPWKTTFTGEVHGNVYGLGHLPNIPESADIDNYTVPGAYSILANRYAETMSNLPDEKAGRLIVSSANGSGVANESGACLLQEYIPYDGSCNYRRMIYLDENGKWNFNPWRKILWEIV